MAQSRAFMGQKLDQADVKRRRTTINIPFYNKSVKFSENISDNHGKIINFKGLPKNEKLLIPVLYNTCILRTHLIRLILTNELLPEEYKRLASDETPGNCLEFLLFNERITPLGGIDSDAIRPVVSSNDHYFADSFKKSIDFSSDSFEFQGFSWDVMGYRVVNLPIPLAVPYCPNPTANLFLMGGSCSKFLLAGSNVQTCPLLNYGVLDYTDFLQIADNVRNYFYPEHEFTRIFPCCVNGLVLFNATEEISIVYKGIEFKFENIVIHNEFLKELDVLLKKHYNYEIHNYKEIISLLETVNDSDIFLEKLKTYFKENNHYSD